jgi:hypothetical protein
MLMRMDTDERKEAVLRWIYPDQIDTTHRGILEKREGTGRWLLEHPTYQTWAKGGSATKILWCSGIRSFVAPSE